MDKLGITLIIAALITGAANTLAFTLQNKQPVVEYNIHKHFFHPYMQVAMRFVSNSFSLLVYFFLKFRKSKTINSEVGLFEQDNRKVQFIWFLIPTVLDYVPMICYYTALNFIPGSVYQILRGGTVLTTYLFSYTCLKTRPTKPKIIGCVIVLLGLVVVGVVNFVMSNNLDQSLETLIGYGLILLALFGNGLHFVYQQHLIRKFHVKPLMIVGMEGIFGILISLVFIPVLGLIPCDLGTQICVTKQSGSSVVEDAGVYLREVTSNNIILAGVLILIVSMATYNSVGVTIAQYMNSLTRALCDVSRTLIIWMVGIIVTVTLGQGNNSFRWESLDKWQILGESLGFIILIIGNLIYYEVIRLPLKSNQNQSLLSETEKESIVVPEQM